MEQSSTPAVLKRSGNGRLLRRCKRYRKKEIMRQSRRIEIAKDTLEILEKGFYNNSKGAKVDLTLIQKNTVDNTQLFKPEALETLLNNTKKENSFQTQYEVTNETTCDAARRLVSEGVQDVMALNFASAKNPGGGFLGGAL